MQQRSIGVITLAFSSVMIALYSQFAAVALILTGAVFSQSGSVYATASFGLGAVFFVLAFAAYFLAYGFWTQKSWAWAGGMALLVTFAIANVALSVSATNFVSSLLPLTAAIALSWYLNRPVIKAELVGTEVPLTAAVAATGIEAAEPAH